MGAKNKSPEFEELQKKVMLAALPAVAFDGWTQKTFEAAADDADVDRKELTLLFPKGVWSLLEVFSEWADDELFLELTPDRLDGMKIREKITFAVRRRIEVIEPHKEAARRATSLLALPMYGALATLLLARTVDAIWRGIGDTSTDINFYTKRAILAGVYSSTLFVWLNDSSDDHEATWEFLDRRIADVMQIEKVKAKVRGVTDKLPSPITLLSALRYPGPSARS